MIFDQKTAPGILSQLFSSLKLIFNEQYNETVSQWQDIATEVPSSGASNDYAWIESWPRMRKWIGDKVVKKLSGHSYQIVNDDFEATVEVKRNSIEDDNLGIYKPQAKTAGEESKQWPDELVFTALTQGFVGKCYDGLPFYSAAHKIGTGKTLRTVSNKLTAPLSFASLAALEAGFGTAYTMIRSMKDAEGRPLNQKGTTLVVGPALEKTANAIANNEFISTGVNNPYKGTFTVLVVGWLDTDTEWHFLVTNKALKPIIFQPRKMPVFVQATDASSEAVFMRGVFKFGAEARGAAGYGLWWQAVGSTGAG